MNPALEIAIGLVVGACVTRALPRLIPNRWLMRLSLAAIGVMPFVGVLVFFVHERMVVPVTVLALYVLAAAAFRTEEVRSQRADERVMLGLALVATAVGAAILGYSLLAIIAGLGFPTIPVFAFATAVVVAAGFGLVVLADRSSF